MKSVTIAALLVLMSGLVLAAEPSTKTIVWDGEDHAGGGGWPNGAADNNKVGVVNEGAHSGKSCVRMPAEGNNWIGWGWNWAGWYPADAGSDVSDAKVLTFWAKMTGKTLPAALQVWITSNNQKGSAHLDMLKYCPKLTTAGDWQEVRIPIKDLLGDKTELDLKKVWELDLGIWAQDPVSFVLLVDDIGFDKSEAPATQPAATPAADAPPPAAPAPAAPAPADAPK